MDRREFLKMAAVAGGTAVTSEKILAEIFKDHSDPENFRESKKRIIAYSDFTDGKNPFESKGFTVVRYTTKKGYCLKGEITEKVKQPFIRIPFKSSKGKRINLKFRVRRHKKRVTCAAWIESGEKREKIGDSFRIPRGGWDELRFSYSAREDIKGSVIITGPWWTSKDRKIYVDDIYVNESDDECSWEDTRQEQPSCCSDQNGNTWVICIERGKKGSKLKVYADAGKGIKEFELDRSDIKSFAFPEVTKHKGGVIVTYSYEQGDEWKVGYSILNINSKNRFATGGILKEGRVNISCKAVSGVEGVCFVWESNKNGKRRIYSAFLKDGEISKSEKLSPEGCNSYNPDVVCSGDGMFFAAWDSFRDKSCDIYGAEFKDGKWGKEKKITGDARMERYPDLACKDGEVWMAWQAQSYTSMKLNNIQEQRIAAAQISGGSPEMPVGLFDKVSNSRYRLIKPRIEFDEKGRLLLSAKKSLGLQSGWVPVVWIYDGEDWSRPFRVTRQWGKFGGVDFAVNGESVSLACQYDDRPQFWEQQGDVPAWKSRVKSFSLSSDIKSKVGALRTEPLKMPGTDFDLSEKIELYAAELPRQSIKAGSKELNLYWGNLHDHTDISVCIRQKNPQGKELIANVRDIEKLDFCAMTDHGYNYDEYIWPYNTEQTRYLHDEGNFVTFLGEEWTSSKNPPAEDAKVKMNRYGHHNIIYLNTRFEKYFDAWDGNITPADVWNELAERGEKFMLIPHQLADWQHKGRGNPPKDWSFSHEKYQPVAEIWQTRGSYEYLGCPRQAAHGAPFEGNYLQDAWEKGIITGVIASPDHGGGDGKVGVWAEDLSRESIFRAIQNRHCFGTSGEKMGLYFGWGEDVLMGDKVNKDPGEEKFAIKAVSLKRIKEAVIFRNNEIVYRQQPDKKDVKIEYLDTKSLNGKSWYYARIINEEEEIAWSSPIWFL